jgi:hypothetical protein
MPAVLASRPAVLASRQWVSAETTPGTIEPQPRAGEAVTVFRIELVV